MITFTSLRATLTGFGSTISGSLFATVRMDLPVTSRISLILDPEFGPVSWFSGGLLAGP